MESDPAAERFSAFVREAEPRIRYALVAAYGPERGLEATAEAFAYAWQHWEKVGDMDNPAGYVYRAGQHHAGRRRRRPPVFPEPSFNPQPWVEPRLPAALTALTERQRVAVVLVRGYQYTLREVAELLGSSVPTVQKHLDRGLAKLRIRLGVSEHA